MSQKERKTKQIVAAAIQEFISNGFEGASMNQIAESAEVSKRTLYKYYSNKEELLLAIIEDLLQEMHQAPPIPFSEETFESQLKSIINEKIVLITDPQYMKLAKIVLGQLIKNNILQEKHLEAMQNSEDRFAEWITKAQDSGIVKSKLKGEDIAAQLFSVIKGQLFYPVLFGFKALDEETIETVKRQSLDMFLKCFCH